MNSVSVCTIYARRKLHLQNLVLGLLKSKLYPQELAIACMNDQLPKLPPTPFPIRTVNVPIENGLLPLAAARNKAAAITTGDKLVFLDIDCIGDRHLLSIFNYFLEQEDALFQGSVRYLHSDWQQNNWTFKSLSQESSWHKLQREVVIGKQKIPHPYELFWSLCFGIRKKTFLALGGFDPNYLGYGGEDTDFAFTVKKSQLPFYKIAALAYHQFHPSYNPPLNHLAEIVSNALVFYQKWQILPMKKWLEQFADMGYIKLDNNQIEIIKYPNEKEIVARLKKH